MRQKSRRTRTATVLAATLGARSLSRAMVTLVAIGGLAACSADQNLPSSPKQQASAPDTAAPASSTPSATIVYVSDASGVQ